MRPPYHINLSFVALILLINESVHAQRNYQLEWGDSPKIRANLRANRVLDTVGDCPCDLFQNSTEIGNLPHNDTQRYIKRAKMGKRVTLPPTGYSEEIILRNTTLTSRLGFCGCDVHEVNGVERESEKYEMYTLSCCDGTSCTLYSGSAVCESEIPILSLPDGDSCPCDNVMYGNSNGFGTIPLNTRNTERDVNSASKLVRRALNGEKVNITYSEDKESIVLKQTQLESSEIKCGCTLYIISGYESTTLKKVTLRCCGEYCMVYDGEPSCFIPLPGPPEMICSITPINQNNEGVACSQYTRCTGGTVEGEESQQCALNALCYSYECPTPETYACGFKDNLGHLLAGPGWTACEHQKRCSNDPLDNAACPEGMGCFSQCGL